MNNDPAADSTVPGSLPPVDDAQADLQGVRLEVPDDDDIQAGARSRSQSRSRRRRKRKSKKDRNPGLVKKLSFVTHLLKTLDLLVFAELSGLYYMEYVFSPIGTPHRRSFMHNNADSSLCTLDALSCDSFSVPSANTCT